MSDDLRVEQDGPDTLLWVKAVPGASRDAVAGAVGDRLKVRVSAAAEGGRANEAILRLLAKALGVRPRHVEIERGAAHPEKVVRIRDARADDVQARLRPGSA